MRKDKKVTVGGSGVHRMMTFITPEGTKIDVPCYEGFENPAWAVLGKEILAGRQAARKARENGQQKDLCDTCAIAQAGRRQMMSPFVRVGAEHTYVAETVVGMPEENGVDLLGDGQRWVMRAYTNKADAKEVIRLNDSSSKKDSDINPDKIYRVTLKHRKASDQPAAKAKRNALNPKREYQGGKRQPNKPRLLEGGTRMYSGRVWV